MFEDIIFEQRVKKHASKLRKGFELQHEEKKMREIIQKEQLYYGRNKNEKNKIK